jgi:hypothetical protein
MKYGKRYTKHIRKCVLLFSITLVSRSTPRMTMLCDHRSFTCIVWVHDRDSPTCIYTSYRVGHHVCCRWRSRLPFFVAFAKIHARACILTILLLVVRSNWMVAMPSHELTIIHRGKHKMP